MSRSGALGLAELLQRRPTHTGARVACRAAYGSWPAHSSGEQPDNERVRQSQVAARGVDRQGAAEVVSAATLMDVLWRDDPPRSGANALQAQISKLRRLFTEADGPTGGDLLRTHPTGYSLSVDPGCIDAGRFSRHDADAPPVVGDGCGREVPRGPVVVAGSGAAPTSSGVTEQIRQQNGSGSARIGWPASRIASTPTRLSADDALVGDSRLGAVRTVVVSASGRSV